MRRLYLSLREVPIDYSWNGPIDYSPTGFPYFGPLTDANPAFPVGTGYPETASFRRRCRVAFNEPWPPGRLDVVRKAT